MTGFKASRQPQAAGSTTFVVDAGLFVWIVFLGCLIIETALVYLDLTINWWRWSDSGALRRLFNTTREDGLASWFAVSQTLVVALFAWLLFAVVQRQQAPVWRRAGWLFVALIFTYMCIDDGAEVHERLGTAFKNRWATQDLVTYAWHYALLPGFALAGAFMAIFLWLEMPGVVDRLKITAAMGCFAVAVGMDFLEGMDRGYQSLVQSFGWPNDAVNHFTRSLEELIEMLGMTIFLVTFLRHATAVSPRLNVEFTSGAED